MNETPPEAVELVLTVLFGALLLLVFASVVVVLMVMQRDRRNRHRAELAELQVNHAEEVRRVEQEMMRETLSEVGRELHDNIGQLLTIVRLGLHAIARNTTDGERAARVKGDLDSIIAEVRRLSKSLNTDRFAQRSLGQVIAEECQRVQLHTNVQVHFHQAGDEQPLAADSKLILFRLFQEALNNALKHAQATSINVYLQQQPAPAITVRDDGRGFDPAHNGNGQGLANLQRRAALIGHRCSLRTAPGKGTELIFAPDGN
jgi:signal transduction histidine kinase